MRQLLANDTLQIDSEVLKCRSFAVGDLVFDNDRGVGAVPDLADIFWKGVLVGMTPRTFLSLTPSLAEDERLKTHEFLRTNERPLGSPFLTVRVSTETGELGVSGHEGRHRMFSIAKTFGMDFEVPVGLFLLEDNYLLKAREIEMAAIEKVAEGARREKSRQFVHGPLFERAVWSHGTLGLDVSELKPQRTVGAEPRNV
ncbi:hypothetical protein GOB57_21650 [Sinorhizobium meliloti]|nr:hypothetical protein [Sinorhizobium meliloti]